MDFNLTPLRSLTHSMDAIVSVLNTLSITHFVVTITKGNLFYVNRTFIDLNIKQRHCKSAVQRTHFPKDLYPRQFPRADHKRRVGCDNHPVGPKYWQTTNGTQWRFICGLTAGIRIYMTCEVRFVNSQTTIQGHCLPFS